ncbi:MAG: FkbM family methyltransferase [Thiohalobacteraceae bacterium]
MKQMMGGDMHHNDAETAERLLDSAEIVLLDIGARYGLHARWNGIARHLRAYAFEPDVEECHRINADATRLDYKLECLPYALGSAARDDVLLHICSDPGCSSLYPPNMNFSKQFYFGDKMEVTGTVPVNIRPLDKVCETKGLRPDAIKIDTQGYELEILKGAGDVLNNVKLVELEVEFNEQYQGQPLFSDVDLYMRSRGFALLGLRRSYWRRKVSHKELESHFGGQIVHGDAVYYNERLLNADGLSVTDLVKFCMLLSVYQQDDFVGYLCMTPHAAFSNLPLATRLELAVALKTRRPKFLGLVGGLLDAIRKRYWLPHTMLRGVLDKIQSKSARDWHDPDFY